MKKKIGKMSFSLSLFRDPIPQILMFFCIVFAISTWFAILIESMPLELILILIFLPIPGLIISYILMRRFDEVYYDSSGLKSEDGEFCCNWSDVSSLKFCLIVVLIVCKKGVFLCPITPFWSPEYSEKKKDLEKYLILFK